MLDVLDMPTLPTKSKRRTVDAQAIADWLEGFGPDLTADDWHCVIEDVHSMPGNGHVGAFTFGRSKGVLEGVCAGLGLPVTMVRPSTWKGALDLSSDKADSLEMARSLWPSHAEVFARKKDDGRAEACLLAAYGALYAPVG